jgi:hypothetical protein
MKLKTYNTENLPSINHSKAGLYINSKAGLFHLNRTAVERMGLKDGDCIEFHQDEDSEEWDWYISKSKGGFALRNKGKDTDELGLTFNNKALAKLIFEQLKYVKQTGRCLVAAEPVKHNKIEYWPLITAYLFKS